MNSTIADILLLKQELFPALIIFLLIILKLRSKSEDAPNDWLINLVNVLLLINLAIGFFDVRNDDLFGSMYHTEDMVIAQKNILNAGTLIISLQASSWLKTHKHAAEFYMLLLSTLIGMFFMLSTDNLLMLYLGLELSTIPLAALVNFDLEKRRSSEGAFKMIMSSALSSGVLLFGLSFLYGATGTLTISSMYFLDVPVSPLMIMAFVFIAVGFFFKISAVPFHLWTADVYEGSPVPVTSYLSVISKGAIVFVLTFFVYRAFFQMLDEWKIILFVISIATMIIGNLFALRQQNIKRFLAFSSIAQVGFILVGLSGNLISSVTSVTYFVVVYVFSNLGAFGVVALVSAITGKENIDDYKGFYQNNKVLTWVLAISLFSLAGIPPTAGFFGKFFLLLSAGSTENYILIGVAALNMVVSLYYYLRIVKVMFVDKSEVPMSRLNIPFHPKLAMAICVAGILVTGIYSGVYDYLFSLLKN